MGKTNLKYKISCILIMLGFFGAVYSNINQNAFFRNIIFNFENAKVSILKPYLQCDALYHKYIPKGNAFIKFNGLDPNRSAHIGMMETIYFRGTYLLYPNRVHVTECDKIINDGYDIAEKNAIPSIEFIKNNDIENILFLNSGSINNDITLNVYSASVFIEMLKKRSGK